MACGNKYTIYILALRWGKYYVGKTKNLSKRLNSHRNGKGSEWTKKYLPLKKNPFELVENCDSFDEDKITVQYMAKYGIDNVRGGSFTQVKLPREQIGVLNTMLKTSSDRCYHCGLIGHFANRCPHRRSTDGSIHGTAAGSGHRNSIKCYNCGRFGHYAFDCQTRGFEIKEDQNRLI